MVSLLYLSSACLAQACDDARRRASLLIPRFLYYGRGPTFGRAQMTESEYIEAHSILTNEVESALEWLYIDLGISDFARDNPSVLVKMNAHAQFWNAITGSLQTSFMMALGRVLDRNRDSHSIHRLVKETVKHPEFFSRKALALRTCQVAPRDQKWLETYLNGTWQPAPADLTRLRDSIIPISDKYEACFAPLRNKVFAHRNLDKVRIDSIVSKALTSDLEDILYFLHDLLACLFQLIYNGVEPRLGVRKYDYRERAQSAAKGALALLLEAR